ncbi:hypothetical protein L7F22_026297 [Adiantum nelumboides]|nr:hypothetical protein [Adiantum nelumboides]
MGGGDVGGGGDDGGGGGPGPRAGRVCGRPEQHRLHQRIPMPNESAVVRLLQFGVTDARGVSPRIQCGIPDGKRVHVSGAEHAGDGHEQGGLRAARAGHTTPPPEGQRDDICDEGHAHRRLHHNHPAGQRRQHSDHRRRFAQPDALHQSPASL